MTYVIDNMTYVMLKYFSTINRINGEKSLIIPCEIAVKSVLPAVKALMAKELVETHGMKQDQVAEILGISQSAVSKYTRKVRGYVIKIDNIEGVEPLIGNMIRLLSSNTSQRTEFLTFFCQACMIIREKGSMCQLCQKTDPKIKIQECNFCVGCNPPKRKLQR
jgi:predicted transcriptional regulator